MARYGVTITSFATSTSERTAALLHANAAGERGELLEYIATGDGTTGTGLDIQHRASIKSYDGTTAGTPGSTPTPVPADQWANAARVLAPIEFSAEPTVLGVAIVLFGFNQRGGWGWCRSEGAGLPFANRASGIVGWACVVQSGATGAIDGTCIWAEA
jgi:hypothetical protein